MINEFGFLAALIGTCSAIYLLAIEELGRRFNVRDEYVNLCLSTISVVSAICALVAFMLIIHNKNSSLVGIPVFYTLLYLFTAWRIEWWIRNKHAKTKKPQEKS